MTNFWMTHLYWTIVASAEKAEKLREGADIKLKISETRDYRIYRNGLSVYLEEWELSDVPVDLGRFSLNWTTTSFYWTTSWPTKEGGASKRYKNWFWIHQLGATCEDPRGNQWVNHVGATSDFISFWDVYHCILVEKSVKAFLRIVLVLVRSKIFQKSKNNISILWKIWRNMLNWGENVRQFTTGKNSKTSYIQILIIHMLIIIELSELWPTCFTNQDHRSTF